MLEVISAVSEGSAKPVIASFLDRRPAGGWLSLPAAEALLATHGIPVVASHHCREIEQAVAVAAEVGAPVALKADFAAPAHASDIDAVMLGLEFRCMTQECVVLDVRLRIEPRRRVERVKTW